MAGKRFFIVREIRVIDGNRLISVWIEKSLGNVQDINGIISAGKI